jgi:hypothetical protein
MTAPNDSILVTPGSGATVATHLKNSKEHQVIIGADAFGELHGTQETWVVQTDNQVNVAAARTTHFDMFNASGSGKKIRIKGIFIVPTLTAVSGIGLTWELIRTSAVGTGGSSLTPQPYDSNNAALPAQVTARGKPTGGATTSITWLRRNSSSEETTPYAGLASQVNHVPCWDRADVQPIVLNEGEGLKIDQTTNSSVGSTNIVVVFTVDAG